jgi:hypothetical protein
LKKNEIHLYQNGKKISFNNKTWNSINKSEGINVDWKTFSKILNNKFIIQSFIGTIDSYRCREHYIQIMKNFKLDMRTNTELIEYVNKKRINTPNKIKENIHYHVQIRKNLFVEKYEGLSADNQ